MRLRKILFEEVHDNVWRKFKDDCAAFIEINEEKLRKGYYLYRGTSEYDKKVIKKGARQRRRVHGGAWRTWAYEYFRPPDYPSRENMIPTFGGERVYDPNDETHLVFPIGHNYKLQYTHGLKDFNDNGGNPMNFLDSPPGLFTKYKEGTENMPKHVREEMKSFARWFKNQRSMEYDDIRRYFEKAWEKLQYFSQYEPHIKEKMEEFENSVEEFFEKSEVSKELPDERGIEVGVYAPNGFYYVKPKVLEKRSLFN